MKKLFIISFLLSTLIPFLFASLTFGQEYCDHCNAVLNLAARDEFESRTRSSYNIATNELFSHDYTYWENYEGSSIHTARADAAYSIFSASFADRSSNSEKRQKFELMKSNYQANKSISQDEEQYIFKKIASETAIHAWENCINESCTRGIFLKKEGNSENEFIITLGWIPGPGNVNSATVQSVVCANCELQEGDLRDGARITPYNSLLRKVVRKDKNQDLNVTVSVTGFGTKQITIAKGEDIVEKSSTVPIGTIVASVLDYSTFAALNKEPAIFSSSKSKWAPADGRSVVGSVYGSFSKSVPDLRGIFLRGRNQFYPNDEGTSPIAINQADPEGIRNAGTGVQPDEFKKHTHAIAVYRDTHGGFRDGISGAGFVNNSKEVMEPVVKDAYPFSTILEQGGSQETRPKNVTVYYYIRIN